MRTLRVPVTVRNVRYLTATTGTATTPDPGILPTQCTFVFKVRGPTSGGADLTIVSQAGLSGNWSWVLQRNHPSGQFKMFPSASGSSFVAVNAPNTTPIASPADETAAASFDFSAATMTLTAWTFPGGAWTSQGAGSPVAKVTPFNSTYGVTIGAWFAAGSAKWTGRIYWVELRTGLDPAAGTVLWRFDANDYPGTGTSWTDPRGQVWTLTTAAAMGVEPTATYVYPVARSVVRVP